MYTSQVPILRIEAGKLDALSFSEEPEGPVPFWSFLPWVAVALGELAWESLIWINSKREGLFLNFNPKGLGSSNGLYCDGGVTDKPPIPIPCCSYNKTPIKLLDLKKKLKISELGRVKLNSKPST